jgi:hypothetical protein
MSDSVFLKQLSCEFEIGGKWLEGLIAIADRIEHDEKMIDAVLEDFEDRASACPAQVYSWEHPIGCEETCKDFNESFSDCWKLYFESKLEVPE